ncbi:MAG: DUF2461 domain-containing protein [Vicinamibacteraceae bacterium]
MARRPAAAAAHGPIFFTGKALTFLRALKRNNDGEWFRAHRADYVTHIQEPLHRLLETLNDDLHDVAPELACTARESTFRMYRDTRFSEDKTPLKTHVAWSLRPRGFPKGYAAGLYAQFDPSEVWIGGGLYHPEPAVRTAEREHIAANHRRLTAIVQAPAFRQHLGALEGDTLTRVPRGFDPAHPAAGYLKFKDWMVSRSLPGPLVTEPAFYPTLVAIFRAAAPLIRFLNEPIAAIGASAPPRRGRPRGVERGVR